MPKKYAENIFAGGMNKDLSERINNGTTYTDGHNVMISGDGKDLSISGIPDGNKLLSSDISSYDGYQVLKVLEAESADPRPFDEQGYATGTFTMSDDTIDPGVPGAYAGGTFTLSNDSIDLPVLQGYAAGTFSFSDSLIDPFIPSVKATGTFTMTDDIISSTGQIGVTIPGDGTYTIFADVDEDRDLLGTDLANYISANSALFSASYDGTKVNIEAIIGGVAGNVTLVDATTSSGITTGVTGTSGGADSVASGAGAMGVTIPGDGTYTYSALAGDDRATCLLGVATAINSGSSNYSANDFGTGGAYLNITSDNYGTAYNVTLVDVTVATGITTSVSGMSGGVNPASGGAGNVGVTIPSDNTYVYAANDGDSRAVVIAGVTNAINSGSVKHTAVNHASYIQITAVSTGVVWNTTLADATTATGITTGVTGMSGGVDAIIGGRGNVGVTIPGDGTYVYYANDGQSRVTVANGLTNIINTTSTKHSAVNNTSYIQITADDSGTAYNVTMTDATVATGITTGVTGLAGGVDGIGSAGGLRDNVVVVVAKYREAAKTNAGLIVYTINKNSEIFEIISEPLPDTQYEDIQNIDAKIFSEGGFDYAYITDGNNQMIKVPITPLATTIERTTIGGRLDVFPGIGVDLFAVNSGTGGSLLVGAYQFTGRFIDKDTNLMSPLMPLTRQVFIHDGGGTGVTGGVTDKEIVVRIHSQTGFNGFTNYSHFQLYSIDKVFGLDSYQKASVRDFYEITATDISNGYIEIKIQSNDIESSIDISELTIDKAPIKRFKTFDIKNNRILAGDIEYVEFDYLEDKPAVIPGSSSLLESALSAQDESISGLSREIGYFRDEVYRFGVSYFDKFGNYSPVSVFDMTGVPSNYITGATDYKFPHRGANKLADASFNGRRLGLDIAFENHPKNAVGFVIVRAKRKKNIIFQSPRLSMMILEQQQAKGDYPVVDSEGNTITTGIPSGDTFCIETDPFVPKKGSYTRTQTSGGFDIKSFNYDTTSTNSFVFDPEWIYNNNPRSLTGKRIEFADIALNKLNTVSGIGTNDGNSIGSRTFGSFWNEETDYWKHANIGDPSTVPALIDHLHIDDNFGAKISLSIASSYGQEKSITGSGEYYGGFDDLQPSGVDEGIAPRGIKGNIVTEPKALDRLDYFLVGGTGGGLTIGGNSLSNTNFVLYDTNPNLYFHSSSWSQGNYSSAIEIVNITNGLDDYRYGAIDENLEFISTGENYFFGSSDIDLIKAGTNLPVTKTVWGGDCHISRHTFNISKTTYGITDNSLTVAAGKLIWGKSFDSVTPIAGNDTDRIIPVDSAGGLLSVMLESEFNGELANYGSFSTDVETSTRRLSVKTVAQSKTDLTYELSKDLSSESDSKIFRVESKTNRDLNFFKSRLVYSNQKIYNSTIEGFGDFNILDYYDYDGSDGDIQKIKIFKDNLYVFQNSSIIYQPVNKNIIETADGITMSLTSGAILGNPIKVSNFHGTLNLDEVVETKNSLVFVDHLNRKLTEFDGSNFAHLSDKGMSDYFSDRIDTLKLTVDYLFVKNGRLAYDSERDEIICYYAPLDSYGNPPTQMDTLIYSKKYNVWTSRVTTGSNKSQDWIFEIKTIGGNVFQQLGGTGNMYSLYVNFLTRTEVFLFDSYCMADTPLDLINEANVTFIINPNDSNTCVFDEAIIYSEGENLDTIRMTTLNSGDYTVSDSHDLSSAGYDREGLIRVRDFRESNSDQRLRGQWAWEYLTLGTNRPVSVTKVLNKYRTSKRAIRNAK